MRVAGTIDHIHASGRFDQSARLLESSLVSYRKKASVISVTEVDDNARARLLKDDDWGGVYGNKGPRDDCGLTWDKAVWEKVWAGTITVSPKTYVNDRGWKVDTTEAAYAVLRHKATGQIGVFGSVHTPHGMQTELRAEKVRSDVALAYVSITRGFRREAQRLMRKYNATFQVLSGDWNLNVRQLWVRAWFATYMKSVGLKMNWKPPYPVRGTHGKEIIDASLYKGLTLLGKSVVLANQPGDDHTGFKNRFRLAA